MNELLHGQSPPPLDTRSRLRYDGARSSSVGSGGSDGRESARRSSPLKGERGPRGSATHLGARKNRQGRALLAAPSARPTRVVYLVNRRGWRWIKRHSRHETPAGRKKACSTRVAQTTQLYRSLTLFEETAFPPPAPSARPAGGKLQHSRESSLFRNTSNVEPTQTTEGVLKLGD